ncbi:hypothetical protein F3Y22_tig00111161pilonHSYRG00012 [Hibiscus syriacus]|uniref:Sulfotransferase n=1 Tax=Hibiscus syriacus TaxID=106335 RepID=A0A6A2YXE0_HIBSY|nr:hypothetical protein F3Y22_tig00111161pilonHSYRG00012 [Hibiscus syriacus]
MESHLDSISKPTEKKENEDEFEKSFKEMISTLPKGNCWGVVLAQQQFQAQPTDIILCSVPKDGTTWLKSLTVHHYKNFIQDSTTPLLFKLSHDIVPFMELQHAQFSLIETLESLWTPRIHCFIVPLHCQDPKVPKCSTPWSDEAFELFCEGECFYGPYWDHVLEISGVRRLSFPRLKNSKMGTYFRKGKVGDWQNCLTAEMAARLDQITTQKLSGSGLSL